MVSSNEHYYLSSILISDVIKSKKAIKVGFKDKTPTIQFVDYNILKIIT